MRKEEQVTKLDPKQLANMMREAAPGDLSECLNNANLEGNLRDAIGNSCQRQK